MDVGDLNGSEIVWDVVAPTTVAVRAREMVAGDYAGLAGSVAARIGAGVNVLVGGSGQWFTLQPAGVEG
jgi:hypothetical protein